MRDPEDLESGVNWFSVALLAILFGLIACAYEYDGNHVTKRVEFCDERKG